MLHFETIEPKTQSLLNDLMALESLKHFCLVGGTNLSLIYGHRISLDLFSFLPFENELIIEDLSNYFKHKLSVISSNKVGVFCFINDIKVD